MGKSVLYVLGDICPRWGNGEQFSTLDPYNVFHEIMDKFSEADLVVANLEAPATENENKLKKNSVNLKTDPRDIKVLKEAGINGFALANNHILDYGTEGVIDTICHIQNEGMFCYGAGTQEEASEPQIIEINELRIGLLSFAEQEFNCAKDYQIGANLWDDLDGITSIRKTRKLCDYLIVQYHGGIEEYPYPSPKLQKKCRAMAEAGADLITCQHSHCIGTREKWGNTEILYGQGNSIFGYEMNNVAWNQGLIIKIEIHENTKISYIPIVACEDGEHLMPENEATDFLVNFNKSSERITDYAFVNSEWTEHCMTLKNAYLPMAFSWGRLLNKLNRITNGGLIKIFTKEKAKANAMNLIRCDAHREVITTVLESEYKR